MSSTAVLRLVRAVQRDELTESQRDALAQLLLAVHVAVELDEQPAQEWRPVRTALRDLVQPRSPRGGNVVPLRTCSGRPVR